jgi:hypothetical protein
MTRNLGYAPLGKSKTIKVPSQNVKLDPRAATEVDVNAKNYIPTGDKVKVKGTRRMLSTKNKTATWY